MNNDTNSSTVDLNYYYQHIGFGLAAVVTNYLILFILARNRGLLKKSAFIFTLAFGDGVQGLALVLAGFSRVNRNADGTLNLKVNPTYCLQNFVSLFLLGCQLPAIMFALIGGERLLAVYYFEWYYKKWSNKLAWISCVIALVYCIVSVFIAWLIAYTETNVVEVAITCPLGGSVDNCYTVYNYMLPIVGGIVATVATIAAIILFTKRKHRMMINAGNSRLKQHIRRQLHVTKVFMCTTIADFVLTVIPSVFLMLSAGFNIVFSGNVGGWSLRMISCRSALNIFVYLVLNREFRQASLNAFGLNILMVGGQVNPFLPAISLSHVKADIFKTATRTPADKPALYNEPRN